METAPDHQDVETPVQFYRRFMQTPFEEFTLIDFPGMDQVAVEALNMKGINNVRQAYALYVAGGHMGLYTTIVDAGVNTTVTGTAYGIVQCLEDKNRRIAECVKDHMYADQSEHIRNMFVGALMGGGMIATLAFAAGLAFPQFWIRG